jgi:hypothetical protein
MNRTSFQSTLQIKSGSESFIFGYKCDECYQGSGQKDSAYIFRPASDTAKQYSSFKKIYAIEGTQTFVIMLEGTSCTSYAGKITLKIMVLRSINDEISIDDDIGKSVSLSLKETTKNKFCTDSNGLE